MSTNGQICYGIRFNEGFEFPWDMGPWRGDHEAWWRDVNGYESLEYPWAKDGNYNPGFDADDPRITAYFVHRRAWDKGNPFPVELVFCGDFNSSNTILAVGSSCVFADEDEESFNPVDLVVPYGGIVLLNFCQTWNIESDHPKWWLSTYRG
jgi:hypothetical protein